MLDDLAKLPLGPLGAAAGICAAALAGLSWLSGAGWVDDVVHESEFSLMRSHVEDEARHNAADHAELKAAVAGLRTDIKDVLMAVRK